MNGPVGDLVRVGCWPTAVRPCGWTNTGVRPGWPSSPRPNRRSGADHLVRVRQQDADDERDRLRVQTGFYAAQRVLLSGLPVRPWSGHFACKSHGNGHSVVPQHLSHDGRGWGIFVSRTGESRRALTCSRSGDCETRHVGLSGAVGGQVFPHRA